MNEIEKRVQRREKVRRWLMANDVNISITIPNFETDEKAELFIRILEDVIKPTKE